MSRRRTRPHKARASPIQHPVARLAVGSSVHPLWLLGGDVAAVGCGDAVRVNVATGVGVGDGSEVKKPEPNAVIADRLPAPSIVRAAM